MKLQICMITLCVEDLDKSIKFYTEGLGIEGEVTRGDGTATISPEEGLPIALFTRGEFGKFAGNMGPENSTQACVSHVAGSCTEVDGILAKAKAAGGTLIHAAKEYEWGYSGFFKDIDGHLWEIVFFQE
jgi:predicted lactoylglutathione lyase